MCAGTMDLGSQLEWPSTRRFGTFYGHGADTFGFTGACGLPWTAALGVSGRSAPPRVFAPCLGTFGYIPKINASLAVVANTELGLAVDQAVIGALDILGG